MCIVLNCRAGGHYFGRSYDRDFDSGEKIVFTPRRFRFVFLNGEIIDDHGSMIGTALVANDIPVYYEAANESGLCMAAVGFRDHAEYFDTAEDGNLNVSSFELIPYVLTHCGNLSEGVELLHRVRVIGGNITKKLKTYPVRWMISDSTGSFVVEPFRGGIWITPDVPEVLTDGPPFSQLMGTLGRYVHLTRRIPKNRLPDELQSGHHEKGIGSLGLPGDYSAMSRFLLT